MSTRASAQVNAEVLRPVPLRAGWTLEADGSVALFRGNIELLEVGTAARVRYQTLRPVLTAAPGETAPLPFIAQRVFLAARLRFAERGTVPFSNQAFVHGRWTGIWQKRIGTDVFVQYQFNEFLKLQGRFVSGIGARFEIVHDPVVLVWGGSGYMFEYNRIRVVPDANDAPETFEHRWTNYLTGRLALFESRLLLQNTIYYQPRFDNFSDFRMLEELEVLTKVSEVFAFGVTVGILYDSAPPTGVRPTDLRLLTTARISF